MLRLALIVQNANVCLEGITPLFDGLLRPLWEGRTAATETSVLKVFERTGRYTIPTRGPHPGAMNPDARNMDQWGLDRPGNKAIQLDLQADYHTNLSRYPEWQAYRKRHQPPTLVVWGQKREGVMTTIYIATGDALVVVTRRDDRWQAGICLAGRQTQCVAADPLRPELAYAGTFGDGVFCSSDAGITWQPAGGLPHGKVTALAVSTVERVNGRGVVYAGTEPSAVFRSEDGGASWRELAGLTELPSAATWSFPPRPETHHVRHILPDPHAAGRLYVAIEAGALVRTADGRTWHDRVPGGPRDTHTLAAHPAAAGRLYSAAGDGYFESRDGGDTWRRLDDGLRDGYCWSVAVDPADPDTILLTAAPGPREAHGQGEAESRVYRRTDGAWSEVRTGLAEPTGRRAPVVAADVTEPGSFYLASEGELYRSADAGASWERLSVGWPRRNPTAVGGMAVGKGG